MVNFACFVGTKVIRRTPKVKTYFQNYGALHVLQAFQHVTEKHTQSIHEDKLLQHANNSVGNNKYTIVAHKFTLELSTECLTRYE